MVGMTRCTSVAPLGSQFDSFLFAPIGEERNGMPLSVVSALARSDVDPWQEAASLAQLSRTAATRRLAALIAALPVRPLALLDPGLNAARLIARLPRRTGLPAPSTESSPETDFRAVIQSKPFRYAAFMLLLVVLGGLRVEASQRTTVRANGANAPALSTITTPTQSPTSGQ